MLINTTTLAIDFISKSFQLSDGSVINCLIYDTCGQERYNSINESYFKKADAALLVYDITEKKTFDVIKEYYTIKIKENCKKNIPIILLGNKADKEDKRKVETEEGIKLALKEKYKFKETSCLKNENVADAFEALIELWNFEVLKKNIIRRNRNHSLIKLNHGNEEVDEDEHEYNANNKNNQNKTKFNKTVILRIKKHQKKNKKKKKICCSE